MDFEVFIATLIRQLSLPLPGAEAQLAMSSHRRLRERSALREYENAIRSSVLILLYPGRINPVPTFVVTLRPIYNGIHSGQISLPGGRFEITDKDMKNTALRETKEEIGMDVNKVTVIGMLTELYIPPSNYLVQPFVGFATAPPLFLPQPEEVEKIIEIEIADLMDKRNKTQVEISAGGIQFPAPSFVINGTTIWGATAMMLNEFTEVIRNFES